ncbi:MAG: DNA pilot protein [Microviridae sp.]|nr:MAG: DNA pilot protein [Microviridae sp.]
MAGEEIALYGIGQVANQLTAKQQYEREKNLMDIQNRNQLNMMSEQVKNQMNLNEQGQNLQMQTWEQTNYPAQMAMLKKAGLNAGLLYAKGGAGGSTGGQGGGSASGGSASGGHATEARNMDITSIMQMKQMKAQADALEADARLKNADAKIKEEYGGGQAGADIGAKEAGAEASRASAEESRARKAGIEIANAYSAREKQTIIDRQLEETKKIALENKWTTEQWTKNREMLSAQVTGQLIRNEAEKIGNDLKLAEIEAISVKIAQEAERIMQTGRSLDQKDREIRIQEFKAQIDADYPGAWDVVGKVMNEAYSTLDYIYKYFDSAQIGNYNNNPEYVKFNQLK